MDFRWWDEAHEALWRIAGHAELLEARNKARQTARGTVAPLLAQACATSEWTGEKARVLRALDAQGITGILASAHNGLTLPLAWPPVAFREALRRCPSATLEPKRSAIAIWAALI